MPSSPQASDVRSGVKAEDIPVGYSFHVTRAPEHWAANEGYEIAADEWLALVTADAELVLAGVNGDYFTLWSGGSRYPDAWFNWEGGNIETKNPDAPMIMKMVEIAGTGEDPCGNNR